MPLDYRTASLKAQGRDVDSFCVSSFLAEDALVASLQHGPVALAERHLGQEVVVNLDRRGRCPVQVFDENRRLAVSVGKAVRADLHKHGLELKRAKVEVRGAGGRRLGDHDMIAQVVMNSDMSLPDDRTPSGLLSGELRCRRLWSESGRNAFRSASHKESDFELPWWQDCLRSDASGKWSGRFILLCCFDQACNHMVTYCDVRLREQDHYKGLWGWRGSGRMLTGASASVPRALPPPPMPAASPKAKSQAKASPRRRTWGDLDADLQRRGLYRLELPPGASRRVRVASCQLVTDAFGKSRAHVHEHVLRAKRRHKWPDQDCFEAPRLAPKRGGKPEHVAVEQCLRQLYADMS